MADYNDNADAYVSNATEPGAWLSTLTFAFLVGLVLGVWPLTWLVRKVRKMLKGKRRLTTLRRKVAGVASKKTGRLSDDVELVESPPVDNANVPTAAKAGKEVALPLRRSNSMGKRWPSFKFGRRKNVVSTQLHVASDNDAETVTSDADAIAIEREDIIQKEVGTIHALIDGSNKDLLVVRGDGEEMNNSYAKDEDEPRAAWDLHQEMLDLEDDILDCAPWDDYDWKEIPPIFQEAAMDLGYDESSWDEGGTVATSGVLWANLTTRQRRAACTMGYNEAFWDAAARKEVKMADEFGRRASNPLSSLAEYVTCGCSDPISSATEDITRGWNTFYSVIKCDRETWKICKIAIPATFETGFGTAIEALQIAIISRYLGEDALMATAMVDLALTLTHLIGDGLGGAEEVMASQAVGMNNYFQAGAVTQMSALLYIAISVPSYIFWYFFIGDCCRALGLNEDVAELAIAYIPYYGAARLVDDGLANILGGLMRVYGLNWQMALIDTMFSGCHLFAIAYSIIYYGVDLRGMAVIEAALSLIYGFVMFGLCSYMDWLRPFRQGLLGNFSLKNGKLMKRMLKLAAPVAFTELVSSGEWSLLTIFAAYMGEAELSAWYIAGAIWEIFENAPEGISSVAVIRVGYHLGNMRPRVAKIASYKTLLFSVIWSTILTVVFVFFDNNIIGFFSPQDNAVDALLEAAVPLIGAGNIVMCVGNLAWNILTAQSRPKVPLWVNTIVGVIGTCIPLSSYWTFRKGYNTTALVSAVVIAQGAVSLVLLTFVFTTNWSKRCSKIISALSLSTEEHTVSEIDIGIQTDGGAREAASSMYLLHEPKARNKPSKKPPIKNRTTANPSSLPYLPPSESSPLPDKADHTTPPAISTLTADEHEKEKTANSSHEDSRDDKIGIRIALKTGGDDSASISSQSHQSSVSSKSSKSKLEGSKAGDGTSSQGSKAGTRASRQRSKAGNETSSQGSQWKSTSKRSLMSRTRSKK